MDVRLDIAGWQTHDTAKITNELMTGANGLPTKQSLKYRYARAMGTLTLRRKSRRPSDGSSS